MLVVYLLEDYGNVFGARLSFPLKALYFAAPQACFPIAVGLLCDFTKKLY